nr:immunoglobulin light chain junction region [Macaca mulatta]MOX71865.1 immunoglobulin light chain junction region [Macaca mulatta]MOX77647.1 immunoglobulin light chain junction region [Macaca mulatta]MOX77735.1 immunoglobulin light chain junction region [Macaca mulatta]MOX77737.1 immunoglobulin light chain junction region [Macaca mulatta]
DYYCSAWDSSLSEGLF